MEGKIVLLVGEGGPLGVTLQCLIERSGMVALKSHWTSKNLKSQVGFDVCLIFIFYSPVCALLLADHMESVSAFIINAM